MHAWMPVPISGGCLATKSKQGTETLGHGGTNSAQPRTNMQKWHSKRAPATGKSASESPPRFPERPVTSTATYCQSPHSQLHA